MRTAHLGLPIYDSRARQSPQSTHDTQNSVACPCVCLLAYGVSPPRDSKPLEGRDRAFLLHPFAPPPTPGPILTLSRCSIAILLTVMDTGFCFLGRPRKADSDDLAISGGPGPFFPQTVHTSCPRSHAHSLRGGPLARSPGTAESYCSCHLGQLGNSRSQVRVHSLGSDRAT